MSGAMGAKVRGRWYADMRLLQWVYALGCGTQERIEAARQEPANLLILRGCCAVEGLPHPIRRRRHVDVADAGLAVERVDDGVDDGGRRADGACFARALDAER